LNASLAEGKKLFDWSLDGFCLQKERNTERILTNLSCRLYDHVQMLPMDYFSKRKKGEILSLISNDANVIMDKTHPSSEQVTQLPPLRAPPDEEHDFNIQRDFNFGA